MEHGPFGSMSCLCQGSIIPHTAVEIPPALPPPQELSPNRWPYPSLATPTHGVRNVVPLGKMLSKATRINRDGPNSRWQAFDLPMLCHTRLPSLRCLGTSPALQDGTLREPKGKSQLNGDANKRAESTRSIC